MKTDKEIGKICKEIIERTNRFSNIERWEITKRLFEGLIITFKVAGVDINNLEIERKKIYGDFTLGGKQIKIIDMKKT